MIELVLNAMEYLNIYVEHEQVVDEAINVDESINILVIEIIVGK